MGELPWLALYGPANPSFEREMAGIRDILEARTDWLRTERGFGSYTSSDADMDAMVAHIKDDGITANHVGDYVTNFNEGTHNGNHGGHQYLSNPDLFDSGIEYTNCVADWTAINARLAAEFPRTRFHHYGYPRPFRNHDYAADRAAILASGHYDATIDTLTGHSFIGYHWNSNSYGTGNATETSYIEMFEAFADLCNFLDQDHGRRRPRSLFIWHRQPAGADNPFKLVTQDHMDLWCYETLRQHIDGWIWFGHDADMYYYDVSSAAMRAALALEDPTLDLDDRDAVADHCRALVIQWAIDAQSRIGPRYGQRGRRRQVKARAGFRGRHRAHPAAI